MAGAFLHPRVDGLAENELKSELKSKLESEPDGKKPADLNMS